MDYAYKMIGSAARAVSLILALAYIAPPASASNALVVTGMDSRLSETTHVSENGTDTSSYVGEVDITLNGNVNRTAFCVAIFTNIYIGITYYTTLEDISTVNNGGRVGWLLDTELPLITTQQQGAGLQLAIWDIVQDNGDGFSAGSVQASTGINATDPTALSFAKSYETLSLGKSADAWVYYNSSNADGTGKAQTLMGFVNFTDGGPTVPEPATLGVVPVVVALAIFLHRKRTIFRRVV